MLEKQFLDYLQYVKKYSPHTIDAYSNDLNQFGAYIERHFDFAPFADTQSLQKISPAMCRSYFASIKGEKSTLRRKKSSLKRFFKYHLSQNNIARSPLPAITFQKTNKKIPPVALESEINKLLDSIQNLSVFEAARDWCMLEVLYGCGLRRSELISLQLKDIDIRGRLILVRGKGKKQRLQPFTSAVARAMEAYMRVSNSQGYDLHKAFFLTAKGAPLYPKLVYRTVKKYLSSLSYLERRSPHILRHTFATHLLNNGADLLAVKELLGHAHIQSTEKYLRSSIQRLKDIYKNAHPKAE